MGAATNKIAASCVVRVNQAMVRSRTGVCCGGCATAMRAAFDALFARHRRGLMAYVQAMLGEAGLAEDVVQESLFVELVRSRDRLDPRRGLTGWLYRVAQESGDRRAEGACVGDAAGRRGGGSKAG